ncbi:helix-turn-helix domain-containing protein [Aeromonas media]|uniref:helix-turn-helix domain-containing protein n=1 Tax=Aeromonas media TaxID=651 RepID=UPI002280C970|nr:helix-turn-helix transcriptional regulator [Aeromonas media]MCY9824121.1 helix-turn-helix transcriptional regulator [Aeromonas media]
MIKCHLSRILGEKKLKVAEVARDTGINRNTLHRMYNETVTRVELDVIDLLCRHLQIGVGELFEVKEDATQPDRGNKI